MSALASDMELDVSAGAALTIGRPSDELRALWLAPETQSRIWTHFAHVVVLEDSTADWVARGPAGGQYRWSTQIVETGPSQIRWSSRDGADIPNVGTLTFRPAPGDRGTELRLEVQFDPPGGAVGEAVGKLFNIMPREIVLTALYRFRALALTGEIPTTDPQPAARHGGTDQ